VCFGTLENLLERRPALVAHLEANLDISQATAYRHANKIIQLAFPSEKAAADEAREAKKLEFMKQRQAAIERMEAKLRAKRAAAAAAAATNSSGVNQHGGSAMRPPFGSAGSGEATAETQGARIRRTCAYTARVHASSCTPHAAVQRQQAPQATLAWCLARRPHPLARKAEVPVRQRTRRT